MDEEVGVSFKKNTAYKISYIMENVVVGSYVYCYAKRHDPLNSKNLILRGKVNGRTSNEDLVGLTLTLHDDDNEFNLHALKRMEKYSFENEIYIHDEYSQTIHLITFLRQTENEYKPPFYLNVVRSKVIYIEDLEFYV